MVNNPNIKERLRPRKCRLVMDGEAKRVTTMIIYEDDLILKDTDIVILRSYWNLVVSRLNANNGSSGWKNYVPGYWMEHSEQDPLLYDTWLDDPSYRRKIEDELSLPGRIEDTGPEAKFGGGSSFKGGSTLDRWKQCPKKYWSKEIADRNLKLFGWTLTNNMELTMS